MPKRMGRLYSAALEGIDAKIIEIEADINVGLHSFEIVGLADRSLNEARERVNSALKNSGIKPPNRENRKITINLAPADVKKTGSHYDLAIALGYLLATKQIRDFITADKLFLGELALDGRLRKVNGALNIAQAAARNGFNYLFLPKQNAMEAAAIVGIKVIPIEHLKEIIAILEERRPITPVRATIVEESVREHRTAFSEIVGQEHAKRAIAIAAAGAHNVLFSGPPGVGKTFIAYAIADIMPPLDTASSIEVTKIWSAAGMSPGALMREVPFRAPHHSASLTAIIGGGQDPHPGEISLAHNGILFLDELPEFQKNILEALRQPLESGTIRLARTKRGAVFPANFILIAAMNPCPCGYHGDREKECACTPYEVLKYQKRISGPLLDRIDIQIKIGRINIADLQKNDGKEKDDPTEQIRQLVKRARTIQSERFFPNVEKTNADMSSQEVRRIVQLDASSIRFLGMLNKTRLSPRAYFRILKVARTIADIEGNKNVQQAHIAEAYGYRTREEL